MQSLLKTSYINIAINGNYYDIYVDNMSVFVDKETQPLYNGRCVSASRTLSALQAILPADIYIVDFNGHIVIPTPMISKLDLCKLVENVRATMNNKLRDAIMVELKVICT